jgi:hypothetical protein
MGICGAGLRSRSRGSRGARGREGQCRAARLAMLAVAAHGGWGGRGGPNRGGADRGRGLTARRVFAVAKDDTAWCASRCSWSRLAGVAVLPLVAVATQGNGTGMK